MCEQCIVNPLSFGEVLPGIYLMRARRDGNEMNAGDWGLVYCNGPFFVWSGTREKPNPECSYSESDMSDEFSQMMVDPRTGYDLFTKAFAFGFDPNKHNFTAWFWEHIFNHVDATEPQVDDDPFPRLDAERFHDYSIGKGPFKHPHVEQ